MEQLYVGIDVSSTKHAAYLMKPDGDKFSSFPMQNDRSGAKMISEKIVSALTKLGLKDVVIGMEATSIYGDNLVYALREDGNLGRFHRKIHVLNPKQVKNFKKSYPELPKNDPVDAFVIADQLRFGRIGKEVYMDDYCQRRDGFVVFRRTENVEKWRVKVYSLCIIILAVFARQA